MDKVFNLIKPQEDFFYSNARYPAYISAWGTGKTLVAILKAIKLSEEYPNNLGIVFRKEFTDLRDSTIKDFESYTGMKINSSREIEFSNGSIIMFRHLEEMNNIQNVNLGWFFIEQAEELETDDQFFKLFGRLRRKESQHQGFVIGNTNGHDWLYRLWKLKELKNSELFEATTWDNAHNLPKDFLESLKTLEKSKPKIYNRFVMNSWDEADSSDVIIQPSWVHAAAKREINLKLPIRRVVSIDVARYGDDKTVCYAIENNRYIAKAEWEKKSTTETTGRAILFAKKHGIESFAVDEIGVGAGVADQLEELGYQTVMVNAAKKSENKNYYNVRAEIYDYAAQLFENDQVQLDRNDIELIEQLSWAKYKTIKSNGVYQVEAKDDIKERYGRSPDNADAFMNGLWALDFVDVAVSSDKYKRNRVIEAFDPVTA